MRTMSKGAKFILTSWVAFVGVSSTCIPKAVGQEPSQSKSSTAPMFYVSVTNNAGQPIAGLGASDFTISIENTHPKITSFSDRDIPTAFGILFRVSGSMKTYGPQFIEALVQGLLRFAERGNSDDQFFTVAIGAKPVLVTDWTFRRMRFLAGVEEIGKGSLKGPAALYDACAFAIGKMHETTLCKKVLLLISDGHDSGSQSSKAKLRELLEQSDVMLFSIGIIDPATDVLGISGLSILEELSAASGGAVIFPGRALDDLRYLVLLAEAIRHQYGIGISMEGLKRDGKMHPMRVDVKPHEGPGNHLNVTTRKTFFDALKATVQ